MKRTNYLLLLAAITIALLAFKAGKESTNAQQLPCAGYSDKDVAEVFNNLFSKPATRGQTTGQAVEYKFAKGCIKRWTPQMKKHAVQEKDARITIRATKWQELTTAVTFSGPELAKWLLEVVCRHDKAAKGANIEIDVVFGIYTEEYLFKYVPDEATRKKLLNRFTVFLVPYDRKSNKFLTDCPDDECQVFNLGGLQP